MFKKAQFVPNWHLLNMPRGETIKKPASDEVLKAEIKEFCKNLSNMVNKIKITITNTLGVCFYTIRRDNNNFFIFLYIIKY